MFDSPRPQHGALLLVLHAASAPQEGDGDGSHTASQSLLPLRVRHRLAKHRSDRAVLVAGARTHRYIDETPAVESESAASGTRVLHNGRDDGHGIVVEPAVSPLSDAG